MTEQVIHMPTASLIIKGAVAVTTRNESFSGPKPVVDQAPNNGKVAFWGANNDFPQRVIDDKRSYSLMPAVIERKRNMLISGGLRYGKVRVDQNTGMEMLIPTRDKVVDQWLRASNINLFLREAVRDWYSFYNVFPEFNLNRAYNTIVGIGCHDAAHVRLGVMDEKGNIDKAYITDWRNDRSGAKAFELHALDPYRSVADQLKNLKQARAILPLRELGDDQFYYGLAPWDALRGNGWLDVAKRVPELKNLLLQNLMHIRYHIEIDERYWPTKFKNWDKLTSEQKITLFQNEVTAINDWAKGDGQGGTFMTTMIGGPNDKEQISLVRITEKKLTLDEGAYIEDSQEADFIICRDMGLKPSLHGISPSKSGSSPGSGSEDRVSRTNHILDQKSDQDLILENTLGVVRDVNGWDPEYVFWFGNYYAATLDRTMQVDKLANASPAA
jgi:hypothetical protein